MASKSQILFHWEFFSSRCAYISNIAHLIVHATIHSSTNLFCFVFFRVSFDVGIVLSAFTSSNHLLILKTLNHKLFLFSLTRWENALFAGSCQYWGYSTVSTFIAASFTVNFYEPEMKFLQDVWRHWDHWIVMMRVITLVHMAGIIRLINSKNPRAVIHVKSEIKQLSLVGKKRHQLLFALEITFILSTMK